MRLRLALLAVQPALVEQGQLALTMLLAVQGLALQQTARRLAVPAPACC